MAETSFSVHNSTNHQSTNKPGAATQQTQEKIFEIQINQVGLHTRACVTCDRLILYRANKQCSLGWPYQAMFTFQVVNSNVVVYLHTAANSLAVKMIW